jgi:hypothetical protein
LLILAVWRFKIRLAKLLLSESRWNFNLLLKKPTEERQPVILILTQSVVIFGLWGLFLFWLLFRGLSSVYSLIKFAIVLIKIELM